MLCLKHENLLELIGITYLNEEKEYCLVMNFMINGCLLDYLRNKRNELARLSSRDLRKKLNSFSREIFQGMLFLEENFIIHRDLAARNCLINQYGQIKLADFGLTKYK